MHRIKIQRRKVRSPERTLLRAVKTDCGKHLGRHTSLVTKCEKNGEYRKENVVNKNPSGENEGEKKNHPAEIRKERMRSGTWTEKKGSNFQRKRPPQKETKRRYVRERGSGKTRRFIN